MAQRAVQAKVTKTTTFDGSSIVIDASNYTTAQDWMLVLNIHSLTSDGVVRFQFTDSVDAFTTPLAGPTFVVANGLSATQGKRFCIRKQDFPDLRFGVTSAVLRLSITRISGTSPSVVYEAWIES